MGREFSFAISPVEYQDWYEIPNEYRYEGFCQGDTFYARKNGYLPSYLKCTRTELVKEINNLSSISKKDINYSDWGKALEILGKIHDMMKDNDLVYLKNE